MTAGGSLYREPPVIFEKTLESEYGVRRRMEIKNSFYSSPHFLRKLRIGLVPKNEELNLNNLRKELRYISAELPSGKSNLDRERREMPKILDEVKAKGGGGTYVFQPNQPPELAEKVFAIKDRIKAGEKISPPKKGILGLKHGCPQCGHEVKRQIFEQVVVPFGGVTTYAFYECPCGWQYATIVKMWSMLSGKIPGPYSW